MLNKLRRYRDLGLNRLNYIGTIRVADTFITTRKYIYYIAKRSAYHYNLELLYIIIIYTRSGYEVFCNLIGSLLARY